MNLSTNLYESLWFCGLFDLAPKILRNCKQCLQKLHVMALLLVLVGAARSLKSEFEVEGFKLCFYKEIALHCNFLQFAAIWHKNPSA